MKTPSSLQVPGARLAGALVLALAACGNSEPTAATPSQPTETPSAAPAPEAAPTATASASATASAAAKPPRSQGGGTPAVLKSDPSEITDTFGSRPAKLELGDKEIATLRLPEEGLRTATVVTFKIEKGGKSSGGQVGKIYSIKSVIPPSSSPEQIASNGPPFILELPSGPKKDVNLAIGIEDDKGRFKWTIVAPKSVDDSRHVAIFELTTLPSAFLHVTTKPAGGK